MTIAELLRIITPRAWVTPAIASLIVVGFVVEIALGVSATNPTGLELHKAGADFGPSVYEGQWWRIVTSMFLHAGILHIAFNLWAFWNIGLFTERVFGNVAFAALYLLSGVGGSLASLMWNPMSIAVGASGAIFGVYGALLAFVLTHRGVLPMEFLARQRNSLLAFLGYNVFFSLSQKNVDMAAHAGGFVTGLVCGGVLSRDLLNPGAKKAKRLAGGAAIALVLFAASFGVRNRIGNVPLVQADRLAETATADLKAKRYDRAIDGYTQAIALERDPKWLFNRGLAYLWSGKLDLAQDDMQESHGLEPTQQTRAVLCEIIVRRNKDKAALEAAVSTCAEAIAGNPNDISSHAYRLRALVMLERSEEAEPDCARLLESPEAEGLELRVCATIAAMRGDAKAQRDRLDRCIKAAPNDTKALLSRASLNDDEDRLPEAIADYASIVAVAPEDASAWNNKAWLEVVTGDFSAARADADRAVKLDASSYHLGTRCFALVGLGELALARADCAKAVELKPDGFTDRGMLAFIEKRYADARRDWQKALDEHPSRKRDLKPWLAKLP